ncbi:MAG: hypothetical protein QW379_08795 [Thermoplasmata archaeon]
MQGPVFAAPSALTALMLLLLASAIAPGASAAIGAGSTLRVETQTQMLHREGGGYLTWELSGPAVVEVRRCIDEHMGDGDGNITQLEAQAYTNEIESLLENYKSYGSARIIRVALLTKDINADTKGLMGTANSTAPITIHFYFNSNLRPEGTTVNFGDTTIPFALFQALPDESNRTFAGRLDWTHREIVVGLASFSGIMRGQGELTRLRAPGAELILYHLSLEGGQRSFDEARFDTFNPLQCSLELFIVVCVFGLVALHLPRRYMKDLGMRRVGWLHLLVILLVALLLLLFFLGADAVAIWVLSPLFMVVSWVLSHQIYAKKWRGIAKPLAPAGSVIVGTPAGPALEAPALGQPLPGFEPVRSWEPAPPPEFPSGPAPHSPLPPQQPSGYTRPPGQENPPPPRPPEAFPSPPSPPPLQPSLPESPSTAPLGAAVRSMRCPKCRSVFDFPDDGRRPLPVKCPGCGAEGALKK